MFWKRSVDACLASGIILCAFCLKSGLYAVGRKELPEPYCKLEKLLSFKNHGWNKNAPLIKALILEREPKIIVELGSWLGSSAIQMAELISEDGVVYAVDHWKGNPEHYNPDRTDVHRFLGSLYEQFLSNVIHKGVARKIIPWKMTTVEAALKMKNENIRIDFIYVDAGHDEKSVYEDLCNWFPFVKGHGIMCGDDWNRGTGKPVRKAVTQFAEENDLEVQVKNNKFWILVE